MPASAQVRCDRLRRGCGHPRSDNRAGGCPNLTCFDLEAKRPPILRLETPA